ncbi:unnamed protein product [Diamesa serratosioi]
MNLQDPPDEVQEITNKINDLISSRNLSLEDRIKELKNAQESVENMMENNTSPSNIERLRYLLPILKNSIAEKTIEKENIARLLKLIDLVMEQLENPQFNISESDALLTIVKDIENLAKTVSNKEVEKKVDAVLDQFYDYSMRRSVNITDDRKVDRLIELQELLDKKSFTTAELNELEKIYDEVTKLQKHLKNSNASSLADELENESLLLINTVKIFDDIDRKMTADDDKIDLMDLNDLEKMLLELLIKIKNPIAIDNIKSKLTEMRDKLRTHYDIENNVQPYIALNNIEDILNNTVVIGGIETLIDIEHELTQYLKNATEDGFYDKTTKLLTKTTQLIEDFGIAQIILDEVDQLLKQSCKETTVNSLIGYRNRLIEIMDTIKDQWMIITAKHSLFEIQNVVSKCSTEIQIVSMKKTALEIGESLLEDGVEEPIEIYRRIEGMTNKALALRKSKISPVYEKDVDDILDVSNKLKKKLSMASSELHKNMGVLLKLINTLKKKNLRIMRSSYDKVTEKFESFNDTRIEEVETGGLEERLKIVSTDYYRIEKSLENILQHLSSFNFSRKQLLITYPLPMDQKTANEILSKLETSINQPNVTDKIMTTKKILIDIEHAEETLNQAKKILEFLIHSNENKFINDITVPEEEKEPIIMQLMEDENINGTDVIGKELPVSPMNKSSEHKIEESETEKLISLLTIPAITKKAIINFDHMNIITLMDNKTLDKTTIDVPKGSLTNIEEPFKDIKNNIDRLNITAASVNSTTENIANDTSMDSSASREDEVTENIINYVPLNIPNESDDTITPNIIIGVPMDNLTKDDDAVKENSNDDISLELTTASVNQTTENSIIDTSMESLRKNVESKNTSNDDILDIAGLVDDETENAFNENFMDNLVSIEDLTSENIFIDIPMNFTTKNEDTTTENKTNDYSSDNSASSEENITTTESEGETTENLINVFPMDNTDIGENPMDISTEREYSTVMEFSSIKAGIEKNLDDVKRKMSNPNTKANPLKGSSLSDEDSLDEDHTTSNEDKELFELKKPIEEINNDLKKINDIKKSAANHSATINSNIIVNLKSINSTFIDSNLLEDNLKSLLEDSINVNETISRIDETRKYLDELRLEVNDDQQWILEQLEGYLLNVELDSLTSKLIADIKTFLSNFNN